MMAGFRIMVVTSDKTGGIDLDDLKKKVDACAEHIGAIMVTYPSTFGVFDENIIKYGLT